VGELVADILATAVEEVDHVLRRAGETWPQVFALRGDAGRARIEVALAGHVATKGDERRSAETELLGTEQGRDQHVVARLEAPSVLTETRFTQAIPHEHLVRFGQAELPGDADVLDDESGLAPVPPEWPLIWT